VVKRKEISLTFYSAKILVKFTRYKFPLMDENTINNLREALQFSPDNIPLRLHLAGSLLAMENLEEAEQEYKHVLQQSSENERAKIGLSNVYYRLGNFSTAIVILEEIIALPSIDAETYLLYAKLLLKENELAKAKEYYKKTLSLNPSLTDEALDQSLRQQNAYTPEEEFVDEVERNSMMVERPKINFDDVGGMSQAKEEIGMKIIHPMQHPELYKAYGKKIGGGILLYGPPGCGKTHLARATAGQINAKFISVGISDILDMWIGQSEKNLHELFELARRTAPCVLFFDEVDALGASRSDMKHSAGRQLINQFLSEMDGIDASNEGVLVLAATNAPWHLDAAFRRPGRFDRIIFIQPPDQEGREGILKILLKDKPLRDIDYTTLAKNLKDFSGADMQAMVDVAIEEKLRESFKTGIPEPLNTKDLLQASKKVVPSTKEWFTTARNYALYSNESGLYDDILKYLNIKK